MTNSAIKAADITKWISKVENATNKTINQALAQRKIEKAQALDPNYKLPENEYDKQTNKPMPGKATRQTTKVQGYKMEEEKVIKSELQKSTPTNSIWIYILLVSFQLSFLIAGGMQRKWTFNKNN